MSTSAVCLVSESYSPFSKKPVIPGWETEWKARLSVLGVWTHIRSFILEVLEKIIGVTRKSKRQVKGLVPICIFCVHMRQPVIPSVLLHQSPGASQTLWVFTSKCWFRQGICSVPWLLGMLPLICPQWKPFANYVRGSKGFHKLQRTTGMEHTVQVSGIQVHANLNRDISSPRLCSLRKEICW